MTKRTSIDLPTQGHKTFHNTIKKGQSFQQTTAKRNPYILFIFHNVLNIHDTLVFNYSRGYKYLDKFNVRSFIM